MEKPLITVSIMTYNQERYVRAAVRGVLAQTYDPLQIVISDDCSSDNTWPIVLEEIDAYRANGGKHKIVLNRNEVNLGIARNSEVIQSLSEGLISVTCGGDDVSFPSRVEKIYEAWVKTGELATYIWHWSTWIDEDGRMLRVDAHYNVDRPSGAICAYVKQRTTKFKFNKCDPNGWEDWIGAFRTRFYGSAIEIKEPLVYYRCGSGVSTSNCQYRRPLIRCAKAILIGIRQGRDDIFANRELLSVEKIKELNEYLDAEGERIRLLLDQIDGRTFKTRWKAFRTRYPRIAFTHGYLIQLILIAPKWVGDPLLDAYQKFKNRVERLSSKQILA